MSKNKTKASVAVVVDKKGKVVGYLSRRDEEQGKDIEYDRKGFTVIAL